jgi:fatty acid desaturase
VTRSTTKTLTAAAALVAAGVAMAVSLAGFDRADIPAWLGGCAVAGCAATYGIYELGRAHEAAHYERSGL